MTMANTMPEQTHWSDIGEVGFITGMRLLFWLYRHIGSWAFSLVLQPVVFYFFLTNTRARNASRQYLIRLREYYLQQHSQQQPPTPTALTVYRHMLSFARASVDKLGVWATPDLPQNVQFPNRPILLEQLERGGGAILMGAHLGNMEILRCLSRSNHKLKLNILVHTRHANMFNRLLRELEIDAELELIEVSELSPATAMHLSACIKRGEFIAVLADRVPVASRGRAQPVPFLGYPAPLPEGPFILASLLKCPVYTVFCTQTEGGYIVNCDAFAKRIILPRQQRSEALAAYLHQYAAVLEQQALHNPLQWFNFYPFWDQSP
ncbi:MAG: hypothetical protein ACK5ME_07245 [Parahaliea sp.]